MIKNKTNPLIILTAILLVAQLAFSQNSKQDSVKPRLLEKAFYGNFGIGGIYFTATGYYEKLYLRKDPNAKITPFIKFGLGGATYWENSNLYVLGELGILTGTNKHHFEASAGLAKHFGGELEIPICVLIGYRKQKPGSRLMFRTGLAFPEALYFGWGVSF